mgnify:CR=1 FL=1
MALTYSAFRDEKQFFAHEGMQIAYLERGNPDSPLILMIHGWISHSGIWDTTLNALKDRYHVVAIDLLGHGHSDKPTDGDYSIDAQAERVIALADHLGADQFIVIGHSMGGQIALYLAVHFADRIARVIDVSGVATGELSAYNRIMIAPIFLLASRFPKIWDFSRWAMKFRLYRAYYDYALNYDFWNASTLDANREMALIPGIEIPAWRDLVEIARVNLIGEMSSIRVPVLILFGRNDRTVPLFNGEIAHEQIENSRLVILEQCGHVPMVEQPDKYLHAIEAFLNDAP